MSRFFVRLPEVCKMSRSLFRMPSNMVKADMAFLGLKLDRSTLRHLSNMPSRQYDGLIKRLGIFQQEHPFSSFGLDSPERFPGFDFSKLSEAFLLSRVSGVRLDLTNLVIRHARFNAERRLILEEEGRSVVAPAAKIEIIEVEPPQILAGDSDIGSAPVPARKMSRYHEGSYFFRLGSYSVEYTGGKFGVPAKVYDTNEVWSSVWADANDIAEDRYGESFPEREAVEHFRHVDHSYTVRDEKGLPVAKAMAEEVTGYVNLQNKTGVLVYYSGIISKKNCRKGIMVNLTFNLMLQIFKGLGIFKLIFNKTPAVFRTQDMRIINFAKRYCGAKIFEPLDGDEQHQIDFIARNKGWKLDRSNVCHDAYNRMMADSKDLLIPGLTETDAKVFTGYITLGTVLKLALDAVVFFKLDIKPKRSVPTSRIV